MNIWREKNAVISKLRVKGENLDALATRLQLERMFGANNFLSENLPPRVIFCVKKLSDPAPRTLRLNHSDLYFSDRWQKSVVLEIEKLYRRAFRPIREAIPAQAESVVFADDAELLACLANDWCENTLTSNWWWRGLFPNLQTAQTVAQIWIDSAESSPAAFRILAQTKRAASFVNKLQPPEVNNLLRKIIEVFGLENLRKVLLETIVETPESALENSFSAPIKNAPWLAFAPEVQFLRLDFKRQILLGIGLTLARAPRVAQSNEFAQAVKNFRREYENNVKFSALKTNEIFSQSKKRKVENQFRFDNKIIPRKKADLPPIWSENGAKTPNISEDETAKINGGAPPVDKGLTHKPNFSNASQTRNTPPKSRETPKDFSVENSQIETVFERRKSESETQNRQSEKSPIEELIIEEFVEELDERQIEFSVETNFGGVFYLLNLGLYLKLYRDFADTETTEIDLNIWGFVAFLSLELTGEEIKLDNIWQLLAQFGGRELDAEIAPDFDAPDDWRMPPEWLKTFQTTEKWFWAQTEKRLVVRHPSGFSVIDIESCGDVENQLNDELKVYRKDFSELAADDSPNASEASKTWLKNLTEYVEIRLRQALNLSADEAISTILFERRATVVVTATHLDVTFRLADLPFAVRFSGLDRDAGWIPAAGKYVKFHYV